MDRLNPFFLQDVVDRLPADLLDAKLSQLADDSRVAKVCRLRDPNHEFSEFPWLSLATFRILDLPVLQTLSAPSVERGPCHDRDQLLNCPTDHLGVLEQDLPLVLAGVDLPRNPSTQDAVLGLQIHTWRVHSPRGSNHREQWNILCIQVGRSL